MLETLPPDYLPRFTEQEKKDNLGALVTFEFIRTINLSPHA